MTRFLRSMSDLHLEFGPFHIPELPTDSETLLLLSGDIHVGNRTLKNDWLINLSKRFPMVLYVLGNHEHYKESIDLTGNKIRAGLAKHNIQNVMVMENSTFEIPGTDWKVVGGTMWTNFNNGNPVTEWQAENSMNDYRKIRIHNHQQRLKPRHLIGEFLKFRTHLTNELAKEDGKRVIVATHHAPHFMSCDPRYANEYHGNGAYASDMSNLILDHPQIKMWFHGHTHNNSDYEIGECRVICNPRGYYGVELNHSFNPNLVVQL